MNEPTIIYCAEPVQGLMPDGKRPALNPAVIESEDIVKWQLISKRAWDDNLYLYDVLSFDGKAIRPFACKMKNPFAVEMEDSYGRITWGLCTGNNDETNTIELTRYPSREAAFAAADEMFTHGLRRALARLI